MEFHLVFLDFGATSACSWVISGKAQGAMWTLRYWTCLYIYKANVLCALLSFQLFNSIVLYYSEGCKKKKLLLYNCHMLVVTLCIALWFLFHKLSMSYLRFCLLKYLGECLTWNCHSKIHNKLISKCMIIKIYNEEYKRLFY